MDGWWRCLKAPRIRRINHLIKFDNGKARIEHPVLEAFTLNYFLLLVAQSALLRLVLVRLLGPKRKYLVHHVHLPTCKTTVKFLCTGFSGSLQSVANLLLRNWWIWDTSCESSSRVSQVQLLGASRTSFGLCRVQVCNCFYGTALFPGYHRFVYEVRQCPFLTLNIICIGQVAHMQFSFSLSAAWVICTKLLDLPFQVSHPALWRFHLCTTFQWCFLCSSKYFGRNLLWVCDSFFSLQESSRTQNISSCCVFSQVSSSFLPLRKYVCCALRLWRSQNPLCCSKHGKAWQ